MWLLNSIVIAKNLAINQGVTAIMESMYALVFLEPKCLDEMKSLISVKEKEGKKACMPQR